MTMTEPDLDATEAGVVATLGTSIRCHRRFAWHLRRLDDDAIVTATGGAVSSPAPALISSGPPPV